MPFVVTEVSVTWWLYVLTTCCWFFFFYIRWNYLNTCCLDVVYLYHFSTCNFSRRCLFFFILNKKNCLSCWKKKKTIGHHIINLRKWLLVWCICTQFVTKVPTHFIIYLRVMCPVLSLAFLYSHYSQFAFIVPVEILHIYSFTWDVNVFILC